MIFQPKTCEECHKKFTPTGGRQTRCARCLAEVPTKSNRARDERRHAAQVLKDGRYHSKAITTGRLTRQERDAQLAGEKFRAQQRRGPTDPQAQEEAREAAEDEKLQRRIHARFASEQGHPNYDPDFNSSNSYATDQWRKLNTGNNKMSEVAIEWEQRIKKDGRPAADRWLQEQLAKIKK
jgi:hypothetical protein